MLFGAPPTWRSATPSIRFRRFTPRASGISPRARFCSSAVAKGQRPSWRQLRASVVIGFLFFLIGHGTLHWAETQVPSGLASLLIASEPIWVFLMACAAEKRWRMNVFLLAGVVLGLAGVALLLGRDVWFAGRGVFLGAVACLVGAIGWSAGIFIQGDRTFPAARCCCPLYPYLPVR